VPLVILGAGVVGAELALRASRQGFEVILYDIDEGALTRAQEEIARKERFATLLGARRSVGEARVPIIFARDAPFAQCDGFLIEAVVEEPEVKATVLARAGSDCAPDVIFASATSAIPIAWLARCGRPDRTVGTHFMTPVSMTKAVEVVSAPTTSPLTLERTLGLLGRLKLDAVVVGDGAGFVGNRVLMLAINEATAVLDEGVADVASVDRVFTACFGHPMGPLALADLIGLDTVVRTLRVLREFTSEAKFEPHRRLTQLVRGGALGQKSGRGFYDYASRP
jgi:3-hydroxybutyryl-CoA dehydrogenase